MSDTAPLDVLDTTIQCVEALIKREEARGEQLRDINKRLAALEASLEKQ
jgi:hypothetical protein